VSIKTSALALASLFLSAVVALANIGTPLQMLTGNPSGATADPANRTKYLIQRAQYAMDYNDTTREPNWVAWNLTSGDVGSSGRSDFIVDTGLPPAFYQVLTTDYSGSGYDRGHLCPSADRTVTTTDNQVVFTMSNMMPQTPDNNQGVWASFETYCRSLAATAPGFEILLMTGPSGFAGTTIASGVAIPGYTWKIALVVPLGAGTADTRIDANTRVIAIKVPNIAGVRSDPWTKYVTSAAQIQTDTGFTFFTNLNSTVAAALRVKVDGQTPTGLPTITTAPVAQTAAVGGTATFAVAATSTTDTAFTYQWLKNDDPVTGNATATTANLTLTNVQAADVATYTVVVTNTAGAVTSQGANLVITGLPPVVVTPPVSITRAAGTSAIFSVVASGSPTLAYQWRKGGTNLADGPNISGSSTATLTVNNVQAADAVAYDVVVTNSVATAAPSAAAMLTVTPAAPSITTPPLARSSNVGGTVTFSVAASGTAPLSYQWRKGGVNLADAGVVSGATTATLTLTGVTALDAANYDVVVTNGIAPDATSAAAALTVTTAAPGSQVAYTGGTYSQNFDGLPSTGTFTSTTLTVPAPISSATPLISATGLSRLEHRQAQWLRRQRYFQLRHRLVSNAGAT
jgi:DNA/RNA endonuclease G (NUC1)